MKKNLKFLVFSALISLTLLSMFQKIQGMDSFSENLNKNPSGSSGVLHLERGTCDVLNQEIINYDHVYSQSQQKNKNLSEFTHQHNEIMASETKHVDLSSYHFAWSIIEGSAGLIKEGVKYTFDNPKQIVLLGLASQLVVVEGALVDDLLELCTSACIVGGVILGVMVVYKTCLKHRARRATLTDEERMERDIEFGTNVGFLLGTLAVFFPWFRDKLPRHI